MTSWLEAGKAAAQVVREMRKKRTPPGYVRIRRGTDRQIVMRAVPSKPAVRARLAQLAQYEVDRVVMAHHTRWQLERDNYNELFITSQFADSYDLNDLPYDADDLDDSDASDDDNSHSEYD